MSETTLLERIRADMNAARKERDRLKTETLGTLLAEAKNKQIEKGGELAEGDVLQLLTTAVKKRREAAEQMRAGGREELAAKEEQEIELLNVYLPAQLGEAEVRGYVREAVAGGAKDLGAVMKAVMPKVKGRFEGKELNRIVREELGA
jgi:uncharacterized protein YqeY